MDAREHQTFKDYRFFLPSMDPSVGSFLLAKGTGGSKKKINLGSCSFSCNLCTFFSNFKLLFYLPFFGVLSS